MSLPSIPLRLASGEPADLGAWAGQVLLVVNVASKCGLTPQYAALETLQRRLSPRGFTILAFPSNDFLGQEPGSDEEILAFCSARYDVSFPLFAKTPVTGAARHPLYVWLGSVMPSYSHPDTPIRARLAAKGIAGGAPGEPLWNFEKYLVGRTGEAAGRFAPDILPDDPALLAAIERELALIT